MYRSEALIAPDARIILSASCCSYTSDKYCKSSIWLYTRVSGHWLRRCPEAHFGQRGARIANEISLALLVRKWSNGGIRSQIVVNIGKHDMARYFVAGDKIGGVSTALHGRHG